MNERDGRLLARGLIVLALGVMVLAAGGGFSIWRIANPPDPQEVVITDDTGAERITLSCQGGVPSITLYDEAENQACFLCIQDGVALLALRDENGAMRYVNENWRREELKGSAGE